MQIENPVQLRLKETTHEAIQKLVCSGRFNQTEACLKVFTSAKSKHQPTGFKMSDFKSFHELYRKFKKQFKNSQKFTTATFENEL